VQSGQMFPTLEMFHKSPNFFTSFPQYNKLKKHCSKPSPRNVSDDEMNTSYKICFQLIHLKTKAKFYQTVVLTGNSTYVEQCITGQTITFSFILLSDCEFTVYNGIEIIYYPQSFTALFLGIWVFSYHPLPEHTDLKTQ
jgi:hypothetical protein